jgi:16S rRNA (cytosine1402-N4)-methyltransferase
MQSIHKPVMVQEVLRYLQPSPGDIVCDCTVGSGGHARFILERIGATGRLIGIDLDPEAIERARTNLAGQPVVLVRGNFADLEEHLDKIGVSAVNGFVLDLGVSSEQLQSDRGFSFRRPGRLDARYDPGGPVTAADIVNSLPERELAALFGEYSLRRWAARVAKAVVERRRKGPIADTAEFADTVMAGLPAAARRAKSHYLAKAFLAARAAANDEVAALARALKAAVKRAAPEGRVVVLCYSGLEERETRITFRQMSRRCRCPPSQQICTCSGPLVRLLTRKGVRRTQQELAENQRARSARLWAVEKL